MNVAEQVAVPCDESARVEVRPRPDRRQWDRDPLDASLQPGEILATARS